MTADDLKRLEQKLDAALDILKRVEPLLEKAMKNPLIKGWLG